MKTFKATIADKAALLAAILSALLTGIGFTAWLTHVDYVAMSTAQAQEKMRDNLEKKLDTMDLKLDQINGRVSHIEGSLQGTK
jgi:cell division protein FtsB